MWNRRDWDDFFDIVRKRWHIHRPPRPLDRSGRRLTPAEGYSLAELDDAGMSIEQAEMFGLPVDAGRVGSYGPNVSSLREFLRATRSRIYKRHRRTRIHNPRHGMRPFRGFSFCVEISRSLC